MSKFTIDFFELLFLAEGCIPPRPIARAMFFQNMTDLYYSQMSEDERQRAFKWITEKDSFNLENEDCRVFFARFNPNNQYTVKTEFEGKKEIHTCFRYNDEYHISKSTRIEQKFIIDVTKIEPK